MIFIDNRLDWIVRSYYRLPNFTSIGLDGLATLVNLNNTVVVVLKYFSKNY